MYEILRNTSAIIMGIAATFAGISLFFEKLNVFPPETASRIITMSFIYLIFFFFFPPVWDAIAVTVEELAKYLMNPSPITGDPADPGVVADHQNANIKYLTGFLVGPIHQDRNNVEDATKPNDFFAALESLGNFLTKPGEALSGVFMNAMLSLIKSVAFIIVMFMAFLAGSVREVLTSVAMVALPVTMSLSLFPQFKRITDKFHDTLLGLMIAPIFSAIVITAGASYIQTTFGTPGQEALSDGVLDGGEVLMSWFSALGVMLLAAMMPALIAPLMGPMMSAVQGIATSAVSTAAMTTGMAAAGGAAGFGRSISQIVSANRAAGGSYMDLVKGMFTPATIRGTLQNVGAGMAHGAIPGLGAAIGHGSAGALSRLVSGTGHAVVPQAQPSPEGGPETPRGLAVPQDSAGANIYRGMAQPHIKEIKKQISSGVAEKIAEHQDTMTFPETLHKVETLRSAPDPARINHFESVAKMHIRYPDDGLRFAQRAAANDFSSLYKSVQDAFNKHPVPFVKAFGDHETMKNLDSTDKDS
jgi:hypothetical protein